MAKRPGKGHDATQDVSMSQLVPNERPVLHRGGGNAKNDMSLWGGVVVGTQDFAPPAPKQAKSPPWKWIAIGLALVGAGLAAFLLLTPDDKPAQTAKSVAPAPVPQDAAVAETPDAKAEKVVAVDAGVPDAAPTIAVVNGQADAVSGVGAIIKPAKKKLVRKTPPKKKAPAKKKKR
jgi:hypothetical protein